MTKSQMMTADIDALLRARCSFLWIVTSEEARVEGYLLEAARLGSYFPRTWDAAQGVAELTGKVDTSIGSPDPGDTLRAIKERSENGNERGLWIMRDLPAWTTGPAGVLTMRQLRNLARSLPETPLEKAQAIVVLSPSSEVPPELAAHATVMEWPLPDREEIGDILDDIAQRYSLKITNGEREAAIDAAVGLSGEQAESCYSKSLVQTKKIDPAMVAAEKKRVISRLSGLEWIDPVPGGLDAIGGLDTLKVWLMSRSTAYTPAAREYGLPAPRGALLVGPPGTGKTYCAKCASTAWGGIPLLKWDLNAMKGKFVGQSEQNFRAAIRIIEAIGRCVVLVDEIEKALAGATQGAADGGVSADALGTLLSWMQDRKGDAFVIATSNNADALPPELLRKGRFDEVWFVDLPNANERAAVLDATLRTFKRTIDVKDSIKVAAECVDFTGSEIAAIVPEAMFTAFNDGKREPTAADLIEAAKNVVPLSKTASEKIKKLRAWAEEGRARFASKPLQQATERKIRRVEI